MRRVVAAAALAGLALVPVAARAAEWGLVRPGVTTMEEVRARYGAPTRAAQQKIERYDAAQWVYEGEQAPTGMARMIVDFGLLDAGAFKAQVVRTFRLEPHAGIFPRTAIVTGWGFPSRVGTEGGADVFFYELGLLVYFDKTGLEATVMVFTPPQPQNR
ncbi:MAG: hypothetical protein HY294_13315 [Candidatus Rokubacteria bacterium]|nr:hypothetical protein [Candidatus Rokubacteria bacterium]MBI3826969.1 hypothetical protein [Candidatus Rokubacteria bacterium]